MFKAVDQLIIAYPALYKPTNGLTDRNSLAIISRLLKLLFDVGLFLFCDLLPFFCFGQMECVLTLKLKILLKNR